MPFITRKVTNPSSACHKLVNRRDLLPGWKMQNRILSDLQSNPLLDGPHGRHEAETQILELRKHLMIKEVRIVQFNCWKHWDICCGVSMQANRFIPSFKLGICRNCREGGARGYDRCSGFFYF